MLKPSAEGSISPLHPMCAVCVHNILLFPCHSCLRNMTAECRILELINSMHWVSHHAFVMQHVCASCHQDRKQVLQTVDGAGGDWNDVRNLCATAEGTPADHRSCQRPPRLPSQEIFKECAQSVHPVVQGSSPCLMKSDFKLKSCCYLLLPNGFPNPFSVEQNAYWF